MSASITPKKLRKMKKKLHLAMKSIARNLTRRGIRAYYVPSENPDEPPFVYVPLSSILNAVKNNVSLEIRPYLSIKQVIIKKENKLRPAVLIFIHPTPAGKEEQKKEIEEIEIVSLDQEGDQS